PPPPRPPPFPYTTLFRSFFLPRAVPVLDADRQLLGVTVVLADVTHLRRLDEMKSGMISVVSHELKTPLTSIRMGVHLLLEERVRSEEHTSELQSLAYLVC